MKLLLARFGRTIPSLRMSSLVMSLSLFVEPITRELKLDDFWVSF